MKADAGLGQYAHLHCVGASQAHGPIEELYGGILERCGRCGLVATRRRPDFAYDENYFVGDETGGYAFDSVFSRTLDERRFDTELDGLEAQGLKGTVLDIGCATGMFLRRACARGWQGAGVEIADYARQRVQAELGVPVAANLAEIPPDKRYDVVTLHHVLEHIHDPLGFLADEVKPRVGRRLLIEVPNFASLGSRVHGPRWRDLRPDQHVLHFSPTTLARLLGQAGFKVKRVYTLTDPEWSLAGTLYTLGLLRGLVIPPNHDDDVVTGETAGTSDVSDYRPPTGLKRLATEGSRIVMAPVMWSIRRAGLGERLVAEAS